MNERRLELATRRGELTAQIGMQRATLAANIGPVVAILGAADQAASGVSWLKRRPALVVGLVAAVVAMRPGRILRWARRIWMLRQGLVAIRAKLRGLI